jgi:amino acid transporter
MNLRKIKISLLVLSLIFMGFLRDFIFYNLAARIDFLEGRTINYRHSYFKILDGISHTGMEGLKWVFTAVFTLVFFILNLLVIQSVCKRNVYKLLGAIYAVTFVVCLCLFGLYLLSDFDFLYLTSMEGMHLLQSALPSIILIPILLILPYLEKNEKN